MRRHRGETNCQELEKKKRERLSIHCRVPRARRRRARAPRAKSEAPQFAPLNIRAQPTNKMVRGPAG
jgi:hypothetical protein